MVALPPDPDSGLTRLLSRLVRHRAPQVALEGLIFRAARARKRALVGLVAGLALAAAVPLVLFSVSGRAQSKPPVYLHIRVVDAVSEAPLEEVPGLSASGGPKEMQVP